MTDYIEREPLLAWLSNMAVSENIIKAISDHERFPAVNVAEVKHGIWEYWAGHLARCPVCRYEYTDLLECNNYCGNCGAVLSDKEN